MLKTLYPGLTRLCLHSGLTCAFQQLANVTQLKRPSDGRPAFPYVARRAAPGFQILTYHRLTTEYDPFFPGLPVEVFAEHVRFLARYYSVVDLAKLVRDTREGIPVPRNAVAVTFDDGYRDNYELAFPVLRQYSLPATIFLTTGFVNQDDVLWNDKVCYALKNTTCSSLTLYCEGERRYRLETQADRLAASRELLVLLRKVPHIERLRLMQDLFTALKMDGFRDLWHTMLTWDQIREMQKHGIGFGAHTVTHPILSRLPIAEAEREIRESKETIETKLNQSVDLFAYPDGGAAAFDENVKAAVRMAGFSAAVTTIFGTNSSDSDPYTLRRSGLIDRDLSTFASRLCWYKFAL